MAAHPCIVVLTAPSGSGKTSIARKVRETFPDLAFSVSATTRPPRPGEVDGKDYHFVTAERFRQHILDADLIEHEEVYPGRFYGTLRSEIDRVTGVSPILLDIDVKGAVNVKNLYGDEALTIFVRPPSIEELETRLRHRGTETEETLRVRLARASDELTYESHFDAVVVNDILERATAEALALIAPFIDNCTRRTIPGQYE